jgi:hypothetical protein
MEESTDTAPSVESEPVAVKTSSLSIPVTDGETAVESEPPPTQVSSEPSPEPVAVEPTPVPALSAEGSTDQPYSPPAIEAERMPPVREALAFDAPAVANSPVPAPAVEPETADTVETEHTKHATSPAAVPHKPAASRKPHPTDVTVAIIATVIIVLGLAFIAVYAYLKTRQ